jgi:hypothetical protein
VFIRGRVFLCAQEKGRPENAALVRSREDVPVELEPTVFIPANQKKNICWPDEEPTHPQFWQFRPNFKKKKRRRVQENTACRSNGTCFFLT